MKLKNLPLILTVIVATALFLSPVWRALLPAWPGYRVNTYIRVNAPLVALTHVRVIDGTGAAPVDDRNVVLSGGRILAINSASTSACRSRGP
jgi:hypothetical protein